MMVIGIPSGSTEVEIRAVKDSAEQAGGQEIFLLFEPMATALGIGLDVEAPEGNMVVDIGGGTTEIAVISLGGLVADRSLKIAGDEFTADIMEYMSRQYNMKVGEKTAEQIKINVGAAMTSLPGASLADNAFALSATIRDVLVVQALSQLEHAGGGGGLARNRSVCPATQLAM